MKTVKNGIYETKKMRVEIGLDTVSKIFKPIGNNETRYRREKEALKRLTGLPHFPQLISFYAPKGSGEARFTC